MSNDSILRGVFIKVNERERSYFGFSTPYFHFSSIPWIFEKRKLTGSKGEIDSSEPVYAMLSALQILP